MDENVLVSEGKVRNPLSHSRDRIVQQHFQLSVAVAVGLDDENRKKVSNLLAISGLPWPHLGRQV